MAEKQRKNAGSAYGQELTDKCCVVCGTRLVRDEIAVSKRLVNRGLTSFWCKSCLAKRLDLTTADIDEVIYRCRTMGCTLFREKPVRR